MEKLGDYIALFTPYAMRLSLIEMLLLAFILILFILFFVLGILIKDRGGWAFLPIGIAFSLLGSSPWIVEMAMKKVFHPIEINLGFNQRLSFTEAFFVDGVITNQSSRTFRGCVVTIKLAPPSSKPMDEIRYRLKPLVVKKETILRPLLPRESLTFQYTVDNLNYEGALTSKIEASCF